MLYSSTKFCDKVLGEEKVWLGSELIACNARNTAGVPCVSEIKQLAASGRVLGVQLRKIMKWASK